MDPVSIFGEPLGTDPSIALRHLSIPSLPADGPLHRIQYVIELVGPRSIPAGQAAALLRPPWQQGLGEPELYAMAPSDGVWRRLADTPEGSYDSLALAWDLISERGSLTSGAAMHLLKTAESFGAEIGRRALPMPLPNEIDQAVRGLSEIRDSLDIGFSLGVIGRSGSVEEREIWRTCAAMGLDLGGSGSFEWRIPGWSWPLLELSPLGGAADFSLGAVARGVRHPGVGIGFSVPRSPRPADVLDACFQVAEACALRFPGVVFDDEDRPTSASVRAAYRANLTAALESFRRIQIEPGSSEALKLF